jgi:hypothetical protein
VLSPLRCYCARHQLKIRRSFQLGINGDRAPCVSVLALPVPPIMLEPFALESRRLCVAPPGRRSRLRCSGDLPPQRRTASWPCLSWRAKGPDSSTQLPIAWSMMPSETERGEGEARRARIGAFRSSQGRLDREDCENTPLVNYHRLTSGSRASFAACAAIGARNCRNLVASTAANMHGSTLTGGWCHTTR